MKSSFRNKGILITGEILLCFFTERKPLMKCTNYRCLLNYYNDKYSCALNVFFDEEENGIKPCANNVKWSVATEMLRIMGKSPKEVGSKFISTAK